MHMEGVLTSQVQIAAYLMAAILFILSLSGLAAQETAKRGVIFGINDYSDIVYHIGSKY